jgi:DNA-directed RNA polymerase specialized sigma24 family protein
MSAFLLKEKREDLVRTIAGVFRHWTDLERQIFSQAHYQGKTPEIISHSLNVESNEVDGILHKCEQELRISLRDYRGTL